MGESSVCWVARPRRGPTRCRMRDLKWPPGGEPDRSDLALQSQQVACSPFAAPWQLQAPAKKRLQVGALSDEEQPASLGFRRGFAFSTLKSSAF